MRRAGGSPSLNHRSSIALYMTRARVMARRLRGGAGGSPADDPLSPAPGGNEIPAVSLLTCFRRSSTTAESARLAARSIAEVRSATLGPHRDHPRLSAVRGPQGGLPPRKLALTGAHCGHWRCRSCLAAGTDGAYRGELVPPILSWTAPAPLGVPVRPNRVGHGQGYEF